MPDVAKCCPKASSKGGMTEPAEHNPSDYKKHECVLGIGKIAKIFHKGKACTNQRGINDAIGHVIELVAQDDKEQDQAQTLDCLLGHANGQAVEGRVYHLTGSWPQQILQHRVKILLNKEGRWNGDDGSPQEGRQAQKPWLTLVAIHEVDQQVDADSRQKRYGQRCQDTRYAILC